MKALLDNKFAPITFVWGFVECPFSELSETFIRWQEQTDKKFGTQTEARSFQAPLSESLRSLEPLTTPLDRYLLTETRSEWTAIFANGLRTNDVASPVGYLPTVLGTRGLGISCIPDRSSERGKDGLQIYGAVKFELYGPKDTDWLNRIRSISLANDVNGWEFTASGEVQPYEQTEQYEKRKRIERFTPEMLEAYCAALGIDLFNPDFYGSQCVGIHVKRAKSTGPSMSLAEARSHVDI
jgi:hypothetical protein